MVHKGTRSPRASPPHPSVMSSAAVESYISLGYDGYVSSALMLPELNYHLSQGGRQGTRTRDRIEDAPVTPSCSTTRWSSNPSLTTIIS